MPISDVNSVEETDAKIRFSQLLDRVEAGEKITITRNGSPIARLVRVPPNHSQENRQETIAAMRKLAARNRLRGLRASDLKAEGRTEFNPHVDD